MVSPSYEGLRIQCVNITTLLLVYLVCIKEINSKYLDFIHLKTRAIVLNITRDYKTRNPPIVVNILLVELFDI